ncbi:MAG: DUF1353 domain-containing protein [Rhodobacteraceae bacterium]|nr:MAG: DUF1353 domain-containing protein [Paracoccaceae bacterium]
MPIWRFSALLPALALAACVETAPPPQVGTAGPECGGPGQPTCQFFFGPYLLANRPVRLPARDLAFYPLARRLGFVDSGNGRWVAPAGTLTDGASIPRIFISVIGDPRSREFANAAALHDAYCGVGNEDLPEYHSRDWRAVHRMFHDGLRVGGTDEIRAKIMFAAVWLGGPRWGDRGRDLSAGAVARQRRALGFAEAGGDAGPEAAEEALRQRLSGFETRAGAGLAFSRGPLGGLIYQSDERDLSGVPAAKMRQVLRETRTFIRTTTPTPSLDQIIAYMERREALMLRRVLGPRPSDAPDVLRDEEEVVEEEDVVEEEEEETDDGVCEGEDCTGVGMKP